MNEKQRAELNKIGMTEDRVRQIEVDTHWRYVQHTNGTDIRFVVRAVRGRYTLCVWLKKRLAIGVYVETNKPGWQREFRQSLAGWAPDGMNPSTYDNPGQNPEKGHIGDWEAQHITRENFRDNIPAVRAMVESILARLEESGLLGRLGNGEQPLELSSGLDGDAEVDGLESAAEDSEEIVALSRNRIVFGAPGTGKSHRLNEEAKKSFADANSERVTFYATYSYAQFAGTYKPVMKGEGANEKIAYQFVPGPFLRTLVKALNRPEENFLLIIEEINRANAAAVFGDVFQLLDRGVDGVSEYSIAASEDVKKYLEKVLTEGGKQALVKLSGSVDKLKIPANLYLWATMNSADQGVFPLDTAFKRRWSFEYIGIDDGEPQASELKIQIKNQTYDWKTLRKFLNRLLVLNGVNEDKLMGPFFLKDAAEFNSKVLMYLWEDAARMCRRAVFGEIKTYSDLCDEWEEKGVEIFEVAKFNDDELKGCLASLLPVGNTPPKDGVAPAQETNND